MYTCRGRPIIHVSKDAIVSLRKLNYTWTKVARILGISRPTLYRRLDEYNIPKCDYADISAGDLDEVVKDIKRTFPNDGEVMLQGHMLRQGVKVPRSSLRLAIHRVDHANTVSRSSKVINRRIYSAAHPNAVWHIDGMHKLIRWRFVVHAGVDGFSRMIVYINGADNNRAQTVLEEFVNGVSEFGLPVRVRSDHGGENIDIWRYMLSVHNSTKSVITGSSTHNERVERMWRDLGRSVTSVFSFTFSLLERDGILDPLNEVDLFSLHFVFLPRLKQSLHDFQSSWNLHCLSTEGNMSPYQLFVEGLRATFTDETLTLAIDQSQTNTNLEADLPVPNRVELPSNKFLPCDSLMSQLQSSFNPLSPCVDFGRGLYCQVIQFVGNHLQSGCLGCELAA